MIDKWYVDAVEALSPLRYHMFQLLSDIETHRGFCEALGQPFNLRSLEAAKAALGDAELFFTGSRSDNFIKPKAKL